MNNDQINELIHLLGEEKVQQAVEIVGAEKISFVHLSSCIRRRHILEALEQGGSFAQIAQRFCVSRMTVYRMFHAKIIRRNR